MVRASRIVPRILPDGKVILLATARKAYALTLLAITVALAVAVVATGYELGPLMFLLGFAVATASAFVTWMAGARVYIWHEQTKETELADTI